MPFNSISFRVPPFVLELNIHQVFFSLFVWPSENKDFFSNFNEFFVADCLRSLTGEQSSSNP